MTAASPGGRILHSVDGLSRRNRPWPHQGGL